MRMRMSPGIRLTFYTASGERAFFFAVEANWVPVKTISLYPRSTSLSASLMTLSGLLALRAPWRKGLCNKCVVAAPFLYLEKGAGWSGLSTVVSSNSSPSTWGFTSNNRFPAFKGLPRPSRETAPFPHSRNHDTHRGCP